jgi:hypothetical protein
MFTGESISQCGSWRLHEKVTTSGHHTIFLGGQARTRQSVCAHPYQLLNLLNLHIPFTNIKGIISSLSRSSRHLFISESESGSSLTTVGCISSRLDRRFDRLPLEEGADGLPFEEGVRCRLDRRVDGVGIVISRSLRNADKSTGSHNSDNAPLLYRTGTSEMFFLITEGSLSL